MSSRRTYIWDTAQGCLVEVTPGYVGQPRSGRLTSEGEIYGNLQATDGTDLSSRRRHREYMKAHGLAMASDYTETWAKAKTERERLRGVGGGGWYEGGEGVKASSEKAEHSRNLDRIRGEVAEAFRRHGK